MVDTGGYDLIPGPMFDIVDSSLEECWALLDGREREQSRQETARTENINLIRFAAVT